MIIRHLSLLHFRNYPSLRHAFVPGLNLLIGANAQGKSNLLEAVYLLATTKSMRGGRDVEMIEWDQNAALVTGSVQRELGADVELEVSLTRVEGKLLTVNHVRSARVVDFVGQLKAVTFCTSDVEIVRGEPTRRRRFLDLEISQASPSYCHTLAWYRKVLEQRTRLLKTMRERGPQAGLIDTLADWTSQLVRYGARLVERRASFVSRLQELAQPIHSRMTDDREYLGLTYRCSFPLPDQRTEEEIAFAFSQALAEAREEEIRRGLCLVGPHRDDLAFLFNGHEARVYGSQAQQRTVMFSSRLAELALMREASGEDPVCLLDDVLSELDDRRRAHLFELVAGVRQVILTGTDLEAMPAEARSGAAVFSVREAEVERERAAVAA